MTNAMIIMIESVKLMEASAIKKQFQCFIVFFISEPFLNVEYEGSFADFFE